MIEFDAAKEEANRLKHGFSLADAKSLFDDPYLEMEDTRFDDKERRFIAVGTIQYRRCVCVYTWRNRNRRIISLRKANSREQTSYAHQISP